MPRRNLSLYRLPNSYVSMDLETTGLDPSRDGIVEIAGVKVIDGKIVDTYQTLVNTEARLSAEASRVNGITRAMLRDAPPTDEAVHGFIAFSEGLPMLGHNAKGFDREFIERVCMYSENVAPAKWYDTMEIARDLYGRRLSLAKLAEMAGVENEDAHRALGDSMATHLCYRWLRGQVAKETTDARDFFPAEGGPLAGEVVCLTGEGIMARHEIMELASRNGAALSNSVTLKTTMLVDFEGVESGKVRKAREYADRTGVRIVSGRDFYRLLEPGPVDLSSARRRLVETLRSLAWKKRTEERRRASHPVTAPTEQQGRTGCVTGCGGCLVLVLLSLLMLAMCMRGV